MGSFVNPQALPRERGQCVTNGVVDFLSVHKRFGEKVALECVSATVEEGQIFGLIGANGAGKTTLIRILTGQIEPTRGSVLVNGRSPQQTETKRLIGYVPDSDLIFPKLTAKEFLLFVGQVHGLDLGTIRARTQMLLSLLEMTDRANCLMETYSRGMKKRIQLAAALIHNPTILVLDEPMLGFDPEMMVLIRSLLRTLAENTTTVIISTHDLATAQEICDSALILFAGKSLVAGGVEEIMADNNAKSLTDAYLRIVGAAHREGDIRDVVARLKTVR